MSVSLHAATRDSNTSMRVLASSAVYFAVVFGAGFVFGRVRAMWSVPAVRVRVAELAELPLMLAVVFLAARWVNRRVLAERDQPSRLIIGVTALVLLLLAELILRGHPQRRAVVGHRFQILRKPKVPAADPYFANRRRGDVAVVGGFGGDRVANRRV